MRGRAAGKRAAWGLADQAFSSLTNFALSAVIARSVSPREFGGFALVFATYLLALGIARALSTLPLLVRFSAVSDEEWRVAARQATGTAVTVGLAGGVVCVLAAIVFESVRAPLLALAVALPGLLLQESWRLAFVARGTPALALINDLIWTLTLVPAMLVPIGMGSDSAEPFILAWGAAGAIGALAGIVQVRLLPTPAIASAWVREHWDLAGRQLGEFATLSGSQQAIMYLAGAVAGLVGAGALRAGQVLLGPLHVAYQGTWFIALSELVRLLKRRPTRFVSACVAISILLGLGGLLYTVLLVAFGSRFGPLVLGATWPKARVVVVPLAIAASCTGAWLGANVGLRALEQPARSLRVRLVVALLVLIGGTLGLVASGVQGAAWGLAMASVAGVVVWWWAFRAGVRSHQDSQAPPHEIGPESEVLATEPL
jgi:O-antigen/teichoic acid export membrane protein